MSSAHSSILSLTRLRVRSTASGISSSIDESCLLPSTLARTYSAASCDVKAFVEATDTSGPHLVINFIMLSRTIVLFAELQIVSVYSIPAFLALWRAEIVSAVSPD
ncbi:hypothetical protein MT325_m041L [Paramecium bursaria chlorella virus MT325]|uniref:Uncharacterized protein m041L n=2 Tax=Paramecium bursaria Chlorella virus A1 TaxID=381899 RepID=A7ITC1_PBCVM|nr:hypothetical protein FR483_n038L [Paramecium bursaria Chlorella virus FR483]ABT13595.1 hypothetical protein MT325_m041L [Paramecium bursaria chlorella virus MT325]ABT15323.1 hypothetical protein FR483_n038L [Paramecium bursaria Chlorella virus FR483]